MAGGGKKKPEEDFDEYDDDFLGEAPEGPAFSGGFKGTYETLVDPVSPDLPGFSEGPGEQALRKWADWASFGLSKYPEAAYHAVKDPISGDFTDDTDAYAQVIKTQMRAGDLHHPMAGQVVGPAMSMLPLPGSGAKSAMRTAGAAGKRMARPAAKALSRLKGSPKATQAQDFGRKSAAQVAESGRGRVRGMAEGEVRRQAMERGLTRETNRLDDLTRLHHERKGALGYAKAGGEPMSAMGKASQRGSSIPQMEKDLKVLEAEMEIRKSRIVGKAKKFKELGGSAPTREVQDAMTRLGVAFAWKIGVVPSTVLLVRKGQGRIALAVDHTMRKFAASGNGEWAKALRKGFAATDKRKRSKAVQAGGTTYYAAKIGYGLYESNRDFQAEFDEWAMKEANAANVRAMTGRGERRVKDRAERAERTEKASPEWRQEMLRRDRESLENLRKLRPSGRDY